MGVAELEEGGRGRRAKKERGEGKVGEEGSQSRLV